MFALAIAPATAFAATVTVTPEVIATGPGLVGYNMGHFMPGSNTADWWRYSGAKAVRVFLPTSLAEPSDDLTPFGDNVSDRDKFIARRSALRANPLSTTVSPTSVPAHLRSPFVNWASITSRFDNSIAPGTNRWVLKHAFTELRKQGVEIKIQLTASLGSFAVSGPDDWPGLWELWQHYYFTAYHLARHYDVHRYSAFNEPNHSGAGGITVDDWLLRTRFASDAIQAGIADANRDYGKNLQPILYAPTTAGAGSTANEDWGRPALEEIHLRYDGSVDPAWKNFHAYSYQVYSTNPSAYSNAATNVTAVIDSVLGPANRLPLAATEFGVMDNSNFEQTTETLDSANLFLAHSSIILGQVAAGLSDLFIYKFSQTPVSGAYSVIKLGTHYVDNTSGQGLLNLNQIGGITRAGEISRLLIRTLGSSRPILSTAKESGLSSVDILATHDETNDVFYVAALNRGTSSVALDLDVSALGIRHENRVTIQEVSSGNWRGGVRQLARVNNGLVLPNASIPAQSFWLFTLPRRPQAFRIPGDPVRNYFAVADASLRDGVYRDDPDGSANTLVARNDSSTADNRRVALIRFDLSTEDLRDLETALFYVNAASTGTGTAQAHVYGLADPAFTESTATWSTYPRLRQNAAPGARIEHNVVTGQGQHTFIQGQLVTTSTTASEKMIDVTEFVRTRGPGAIAFLVAQEARWNTNFFNKTPEQVVENDGDPQTVGVSIVSREATSGLGPRLRIIRRERPINVWRQEQLATSSNEGDAADLADPDQDGAPNLLEYALGGNPLVADTPSPRIRSAEGHPAIVFDRLRSDLTYTVEESTDLAAWAPIAVDPGEVGTEVAVPTSTTSSGPRFLRLRVTPVP